MALENILSQEIVQKLGWTLLHFVWQALADALLLSILLAVLRKSSANIRYIIACTAMGLIVLLPIITIQLVPVSTLEPVTSIESQPAHSIVPTQTTIEEVPSTSVTEYKEPAQLESTDVVQNVSWKQRAVERLEPALPYLVTGWLLGVFGLSLWRLGGWAQLQRLKKQMVKRVNASLQVKLNELSGRLKVKQAVQLLESALVQVPTVVGWLRPVILLPASALTGLTTEQLEALLAHELAHIRRYDYLANMLQTVVETLGFYHPAVWWISHKIRTERENCCDDLAVSISGDRVSYARALTLMEEIRAGRIELAVTVTGGNLFGRIRRLVAKESSDSNRTSWIPSVITILLIAIIAIPTALALTGQSQNKGDSYKKSNTPVESDEGRIEGRIIDINTGKGIPGIQLAAAPNSSQESNERFTCTTAEDGTFTITGLQSDEYLLQGDFPSVDVDVVSGRSTKDVLIGVRRGQSVPAPKETTAEQQSNGQIIIGMRMIEMPANAMKDAFGPNENFASGLLVRYGHEIAGRLLTLSQKLKDAKQLAAPQVLMENNSNSTIELKKNIVYIGGYESVEGEPRKLALQHKNLEIGWKFKIHAKILESGEKVHIELAVRQQKDTFETRQYRPGYDYQIPSPPEIFATELTAKNSEPVVISRLSHGETVYCLIVTPSAILPERQPEPLLGKKLSEPDNIQNIDDLKGAEGKPNLICFWDMNQRPSRNMINELAKREKELAKKNIAVYLVQTSKIEPTKLKKWLDNHNVPYVCGSIQNDDVLFRWGVQAQPWLILTDENGVVQAEGFSLEQLDEKLQEASEPTAVRTRIVHFPDDRTVGKLKLRDTRPDIDWDWDRGYLSLPGWALLGPAQGDVSVPAGEDLRLEVSGDVTDFSFLSDLKPNNLQVLILSNKKISDKDLIHLKGMTGLLALSLDTTPIEDAGLAHLAALTSLKDLSLFNTKVSDAGLEHLSSLKSLKRLILFVTQVRGPGLKCLQNLTSLVSLDLAATPITDESLVHVAEITWLKELQLQDTDITNKGLAHLKSLRSLEMLILGNTNLKQGYSPITDDGLVYLKGLDSLRDLHLLRTRVTDAGLAHLSNLKTLEYLDLKETRLTGEGLAYLKDLPALTYLNLEKTGVTEVGLKYLKEMSNLHVLLLDGENINEKDLKDLEKALPDCMITVQTANSANRIPEVPVLSKSVAPAGTDKPIVKVDLAWVEVPAGSQVDRETTTEIRKLLDGKITIPDSTAAAELLRNAVEATAPVEDNSVGNKRVTQKEFKTLFDLLVSKGYAKILMNPTLEVVDGETANIVSGQKIPLDRATLPSTQSDNKESKTKYADATDSIHITPHVSKDGNIILLQVEAAFSSITMPHDDEKTPVVNRHEISTQLRLSPGESGIISGLQQAGLITKPVKNVKDLEVPATEMLVILTPMIVDTTNSLFETRTYQLKYADPDLIKEKLEGAYKYPANEPQEAVKVIAFPKTKRVTVIASPENLSRITEQIAEWDTFDVFKPRIIELQNSDPVQIAGLLTKLFAEEGGDEVNIRDVIQAEDIAGPLSSHFTFENVPETSKIIVVSNIPKAYDAVVQLILELDKQKMATKDMKQVREWIAGLVKEGRLGVPKTIDETEQPANNDVTISGQCLDSGGRPLTNAQVLLFCRDSGLGSLIQITKDETDSDGRFILGPITRPGEEDWGRRSYFIFVPADSHGPAWKTVNLYGPTNEPLELIAYNPAIVTGKILTEDSKPVARAKVWVRAIISPEATEDPASRTNDLYNIAALPGWSATTEQDGSFRIAGVPDGAIIQLFISHRDFAGIIVNVKPGAEAKIKVQPAATIAGRVLYGKTGKPAAGVIVAAQAVEHIRILGGYSMSWAQTITDEQGRYKLESLNETKYNIWAEAENLTVVALDSFQAVAGETIEAPDLVLIEGGFITGRVIDEATGEPIRPGQHSDVAIYGPSRPKSGAAVQISRIREDGSFRIRVAPGRNYIYLRPMGDWGRGKTIVSPASRWVNVAGGQTVEVEFKIRKLTHEELEVQAKRRQKETIKYILPKTIDEVEQNGKETKEPPADKPVTRVYDISDLVYIGARISRGAVDVMMDRSDALGASPVSIPDQAFVNEAQKIVNLITQTIDPNSWFQNNPNATGIITPYPVERPKKLAIYQTLPVHQQIEKLLKSQREQIPTTQISIELRYLYTNAEFLDEVRDRMGIEFTPDTFLDDKQVETLLRASQKKRNVKSLMAPMAMVFNNVTARFSIAGHIFMSFLDYPEPDNLSQQSPPVPTNTFCSITPHIEDNKDIIIDFIQDIPGLQERIIHNRSGMKQSYAETVAITNKRIPNNKTFAFACDIKKSDRDNQTASPNEKKILIVLIKPTISVQEEMPREEPSRMLIMPRIDPNNPKFKELEEQFNRYDERKKDKNQTKNQSNAIYLNSLINCSLFGELFELLINYSDFASEIPVQQSFTSRNLAVY